MGWAGVEKDTARPFLASFPVPREAGGTSEHFGLDDIINVDEDAEVFSSVTGGAFVPLSTFSDWVTCFPSLSGSLGSDLTVVCAWVDPPGLKQSSHVPVKEPSPPWVAVVLVNCWPVPKQPMVVLLAQGFLSLQPSLRVSQLFAKLPSQI